MRQSPAPTAATTNSSTVKQILKELEIDEKRTSPRSVLSAISHGKSELIDPEAYARDAQGLWHETVARAYRRYNEQLDRQADPEGARDRREAHFTPVGVECDLARQVRADRPRGLRA